MSLCCYYNYISLYSLYSLEAAYSACNIKNMISRGNRNQRKQLTICGKRQILSWFFSHILFRIKNFFRHVPHEKKFRPDKNVIYNLNNLNFFFEIISSSSKFLSQIFTKFSGVNSEGCILFTMSPLSFSLFENTILKTEYLWFISSSNPPPFKFWIRPWLFYCSR